ncbi:MAG: pyridoxamine 5'-phosphate oxidase family protein [Bacteroidaceae bacterium]|nr:pyridoxamine 5'-phosphate oxidase family protein [Bacteroidaceae bacterium]
MNEVLNYLKECGAYYLATCEGDQPRVRPFGAVEIIDGRMYIMTGKVKNVYQQLEANCKFEICAMKASGAEWMRLCGKAVNDDTLSVKEKFLELDPELKSMYKADDGNMAVLYITEATATFYSFNAAPKEVKF